MATPKTNKDYVAKLKAIRPYVKFDYDLRRPLHSSQKAKINRYFEAIHAIQARANKVYRSKNRKRVEQVQKFGRNEFEHLPEITVAFYESPAGNPQRIKFRGNRLTVTGEHFRMEFVEIDPERLATDADSEITRAIGEAPDARWYRIAAGKYAIEQPYTKNTLRPEIHRLMSRYDTYKDTGALANNNYRNWLHGIIPLYAENQRELMEVRIAQIEEKARTVHSKRYRSRLEREAKRLRRVWERRKEQSR